MVKLLILSYFTFFSTMFSLKLLKVSIYVLKWVYMEKRVISLANNKFLDFFKLKAYADDKINVTKKKNN